MANQYDRIAEGMLIHLYEYVKFRNGGNSPNFSSSDKIVLKLCWNNFVGGDPTKRGFEMFLRMFKNHPETQQVFSFAKGSSTAQMQNSSRLLFHVTRVVKYISKVIDNLDNLAEVVPMLRQLGGRHGTNGYQVPPHFFPLLGEALRQLMRENVATYNERTNQLWTKLYDNFIVENLSIGQSDYGGK